MCDNKVSFHVALPMGCRVSECFGYREVMVKCGNTDPYGNRTICENCQQDLSLGQVLDSIERHEREGTAWLRSVREGSHWPYGAV